MINYPAIAALCRGLSSIADVAPGITAEPRPGGGLLLASRRWRMVLSPDETTPARVAAILRSRVYV